MAMTMHVDIVSLESQIFNGRAEAVFITGSVGEMGIYPGHNFSLFKKGTFLPTPTPGPSIQLTATKQVNGSISP